MPLASHRHPRHTVHQRDAGLRKISGVTSVLVAGSVAAAGAFAALAAWAQPGRAKTPTTASGSGSSVLTVPTAPQSAAPVVPSYEDDGGDDDLAPPATVPATVPVQTQTPDYQYSPPPVVSHAS